MKNEPYDLVGRIGNIIRADITLNKIVYIVYCNGDIIEEETFEDIRRRLNTQEEN